MHNLCTKESQGALIILSILDGHVSLQVHSVLALLGQETTRTKYLTTNRDKKFQTWPKQSIKKAVEKPRGLYGLL